MRRPILLLTVMLAILALASGVAVAQVINCPMAGGLCVGTDNNDTLNGSALADDMRGLKGQDTLIDKATSIPLSDFDTLNGGRGNDDLRGKADNDTLSGDLGDDTLDGGAENDTYNFANGWGKDKIVDEIGIERLSFSLVTQPVKMDLIRSPSRPEVESGVNTVNFAPNVAINEVDGSSNNDAIKGDDSGDFLNGIQGNDTISGRGGEDDVVGMNGNDELFGGSEIDEFDAGNGADVIHAVDGEADTISCGPGDDTVFFDQNDILPNPNACEDQQQE